MEARQANEVVPTLTDVGDIRRARHSRNLRRAGIGVLGLVVGLAALGLLGPRESTVTASGAGHRVDLTYPHVTRPGLDAQIDVTIGGPAGFGTDLVLVVDKAFYEDFGIEQVIPAPRLETAGPHDVRLTFAAGAGDEVAVVFSGRIPTQQTPGFSTHTIELRVPGAPVVSVDARTWVLP